MFLSFSQITENTGDAIGATTGFIRLTDEPRQQVIVWDRRERGPLPRIISKMPDTRDATRERYDIQALMRPDERVPLTL